MSNTILTVEEIQQLTETQTQSQQIALELGNLEITRLQLEKRKEEVIAFLNEFKAKEQELGKSLSDISKATVLPEKKQAKKAFKCYTIDPNKDIVNDQIMIDPTTGECLSDTLKKEALESAGGDPIYMNGQDTSGIMPGDIETIVITICVVMGTIILLAYLGYISHLIIYRSAGFHEALPHVFGFIMSLLILILIGSFIDSEKSKNPADNTETTSSS
jgi:hypothetical protein